MGAEPRFPLRIDNRARVAVPNLPRLVRTRPGPQALVAARRPDGSLISLSELPDADTRWTIHRKRIVVECVEHDLLPLATAERRYRLTAAELGEWRAAIFNRGRPPKFWRERPRRLTRGRAQIGSAEIDLDARRLRLGGVSVDLADSEWRVLATIVEADGAIVSHAMIMGALYTGANQGGSRKIVDVIVCHLRRKLGAEAARIETVWGRGYRLCR